MVHYHRKNLGNRRVGSWSIGNSGSLSAGYLEKVRVFHGLYLTCNAYIQAQRHIETRIRDYFSHTIMAGSCREYACAIGRTLSMVKDNGFQWR